MFQKLSRSEEGPAPSRWVKVIYTVFIVAVLLLYLITMVINEWRCGLVARVEKKLRVIAGTVLNSRK